jgi:hypothetical protein
MEDLRRRQLETAQTFRDVRISEKSVFQISLAFDSRHHLFLNYKHTLEHHDEQNGFGLAFKVVLHVHPDAKWCESRTIIQQRLDIVILISQGLINEETEQMTGDSQKPCS